MPELAEVETIRRELESRVIGRRIEAVRVFLPKTVKTSPQEFVQTVTGSIIQQVDRRAKILVFRLSNGKSMLAHLKMTGRLLYMTLDQPIEPHTRVIFSFDNGWEMRFWDLRTFGYLKLVNGIEAEAAEFKALGTEPLSPDFTLEAFKTRLARRGKSRIKLALLDQSLVAGLGNIYVDELLWHAQILPTRIVGSLSEEEIGRIHRVIRAVLRTAVEQRGTSVAQYVDAEGKEGNYQNFLKVYRRTGKPCERDGTPIQRIKVAGRGTHFCPFCQK